MTSFLKCCIIGYFCTLSVVFQPTLAFVPLVCRKGSKNVGANTLNKYSPVVCDAQYGTKYNKKINQDTEYIFVYSNNNTNGSTYPPRIKIAMDAEKFGSASPKFPLLVVATQPTSILSWQVPFINEDHSGVFVFNDTSRTLCPEDGDLVITVSTRTPQNITFELQVNLKKDFIIEMSRERTMKIYPSQPEFFLFKFDEKTSSALLRLESPDERCMTLAIQNISCPVYDLESTVQYQSFFQTVMRKGGIFLRKEDFPSGMFIIFVMHSSNEACTGEASSVANTAKTISFSIQSNIGFWEYVVAIAVVLGVFTGIFLLTGCLIICSNRWSRPTGEVLPVTASYPGPHLGSSILDTPTTPMSPGGFSSDEDIETDCDWVTECESIQITRMKRDLHLSDLATKDIRILIAKSNLYLWNILTVSVFYALPVVQLVLTYQKVQNSTGNGDLCYYNFWCAHSLYFISDFNHVFSNIGYLLLGMLFLLLTYRREKYSRSVGQHLGMPYCYGMFYALGVALCMEGVLSACYHLCPNHSNFQFDTSFMYVLSMLSMIKIYQKRHPDITARAYLTFGVLALVIFLGMYGVLNDSKPFQIAFTIVHLLTCFTVTAQLYHVGTWKFDLGMFNRFYNTCVNDYYASGLIEALKPAYPVRMVLLCLANIGNIAIVIVFGIYYPLGDFATYMLVIFLSNLMMYFIFYIVMKIVSKEKILCPAYIYIVLSFVFWGASCYFFYYKSISWKKTPSQSRFYNQECQLLNFFDNHDIWHFLSAGGMFFSFMVLLTLDDGIAQKDRSEIMVF